jgi:hypothetical protein
LTELTLKLPLVNCARGWFDVASCDQSDSVAVPLNSPVKISSRSAGTACVTWNWIAFRKPALLEELSAKIASSFCAKQGLVHCADTAPATTARERML